MTKKLSRKDKRRIARLEKERKLSASPLFKKARSHIVQGFLAIVLFIVGLQIFSFFNKSEPTGLTFTGVVVDFAASSVRRGQGVLAVVELENGRTTYVALSGRHIGESLEFDEYQDRLMRIYSYQVKDF